jgi:hypothetical protein
MEAMSLRDQPWNPKTGPIDAKDLSAYRSMASSGFRDQSIAEIFSIEWGYSHGDVLGPGDSRKLSELVPAFEARYAELKRLAAEQEAAERQQQAA